MCVSNNNLLTNIKFILTQHSLERFKERGKLNKMEGRKSIISQIVRILELGLKNNNINYLENLKKIVEIFNNWKNSKSNFKHEGQCILLYEKGIDIYKISCKINIEIDALKNNMEISFIFTTFMNVFNSMKYKAYLIEQKLKAERNNMFISVNSTNFKKYIIYLIPDKKL